MTDKTYNGWTNYETWVVNLWMDNDEGSYDYWRTIAKHIYDTQAKEQKHFSKMEDAVVILADKLKDEHDGAKYDMLEHMQLQSSLWADMISASLCEVNWREIAEHLMENVQVEA